VLNSRTARRSGWSRWRQRSGRDSEGRLATSRARRQPDAAPKRDVRWGSLILSPDGRPAVTSIAPPTTPERWLAIDPASGKATVLDHIKDEAGAGRRRAGCRQQRLWFSPSTTAGCISTPSTSRHRPARKQLTSGKFEIDNVELSPDGSTFYFRSTEYIRASGMCMR
jgi:hypothetical protein